MTEPKPRCGASNTRCAGCGRAVGSFYDQCPACGGDVEPSTCRRPATAGGRCHQHGGRAGQVVAAEQTRQIETSLAALTEEYDLGPVDNPFEALLELAGQARAWKDLLGDRVAELAANQWRYEGRRGEEVRSELVLFERAVDRCARVLADVSRLRIEERLVELKGRVSAAQAGEFRDLFLVPLEALPGAHGQPGTLQHELRVAMADRLRAHAEGRPLPPAPVLPEYVPRPSIEPTEPDPLVPSVTSGPSVPSVRPVEPSDAEDGLPASPEPVEAAEAVEVVDEEAPAVAAPVEGWPGPGEVGSLGGYRPGADPTLDRMMAKRRRADPWDGPPRRVW